eukprot:234522-Prorocentrum_lima.AAC.1
MRCWEFEPPARGACDTVYVTRPLCLQAWPIVTPGASGCRMPVESSCTTNSPHTFCNQLQTHDICWTGTSLCITQGTSMVDRPFTRYSRVG